MKTIKILFTILLVIVMGSCMTTQKANGLYSDKGQKPVPSTSGQKPNRDGLNGPGSNNARNTSVTAGRTSTPVKQEPSWNKGKIGKHRKNPGNDGLVRR